jgi:hypothetical protein
VAAPLAPCLCRVGEQLADCLPWCTNRVRNDTAGDAHTLDYGGSCGLCRDGEQWVSARGGAIGASAFNSTRRNQGSSCSTAGAGSDEKHARADEADRDVNCSPLAMEPGTDGGMSVATTWDRAACATLRCTRRRFDLPPRPPPRRLRRSMDESATSRWLYAALAAWPSIAVPHATYVGFLRERSGVAQEAFAADLYLACACLNGIRGASAAFEDVLKEAVARPVLRVDPRPAFLDDVLQVLRERLLVPAPQASREAGVNADCCRGRYGAGDRLCQGGTPARVSRCHSGILERLDRS